MQEIFFVTSSDSKNSVASQILAEYKIKVTRIDAESPEIQSFDGKEISEFAAKFIAKQINKNVVKTDVSYSIPALNGFPGAFVKFVNKWLTAEDILKLMANKKDRSVIITQYLSYATPKGNVITFKCVSKGRIFDDKPTNNAGTAFDKVLIRPGFDVPQNMLSKEVINNIFCKNGTIWHELGKYLTKL